MLPYDTENLRYYGTSEPPESTRLLQAGDLTAEYIRGELRNIRYQGREVLRAIAYLVRDQDWGTYAPHITDLEIEEGDGQFSIRYQGRCLDAADGQQLRYQLRVHADARGELRVEADYWAETRFLTCRNGFCVLHPIDGVAGQPIVVEHSGGLTEASHFPLDIAPWQPFKEIASMTWEIDKGVTAMCRFEGDVFEMEDQRNWSDASYKTYVRPLARPWPYWLEQGETGTQSIGLRIAVNTAHQPAPSAEQDIVLTLQETARRHPAIGIALSHGEAHTVQDNVDRLQALGPQVLLCHFDPTAGDGPATLASYAAIAARYGARYVLECVVPGVQEPSIELDRIAAQVREAGLELDGLAVCPAVDRMSVPPGSTWPRCPPLSEVYDAARASFPGIPLGGGMFSYFTELNRKRPPSEKLDWVSHATNPIVHAAGDTSVMQTLEAIPHITRSCRSLIGQDKPYWIGPVTLGMRQNPYGSRTMPNPDGLRIPMAGVDPRERAQFGAAWLLGYAAQIQDAALEVLTFGPLTGERGLTGGDNAQPYPIYHVVQALAQLAGRAQLKCHSSQPGKLLGLGAVETDTGITLWVANLTTQTQSFRVDGASPGVARISRVLSAAGMQVLNHPAAQGSIHIAPYACMELCWPGSPPFLVEQQEPQQ